MKIDCSTLSNSIKLFEAMFGYMLLKLFPIDIKLYYYWYMKEYLLTNNLYIFLHFQF